MKLQPKTLQDADILQEEQATPSKPPLSVMAVQDLLGLFSPKADTQEKDRHDYLEKKPLGLI